MDTPTQAILGAAIGQAGFGRSLGRQAVVFGAINAEQGEELGNALKTIAGAVITVLSTLGYMKTRADVKKAHLAALAAGVKAADVKELKV